jgi:hypothetical protein
LRERVSALAVSLSAAVAGAALPGLRSYFELLSLGAAGWLVVDGVRLRLASFARRSALDQLVLAGSWDPRCPRRRADLESERLQRRLARMLRQTCEQSHCSTAGSLWLVDREVVHAVEADLRELATVFDHNAGHPPPAAVALVHLLLASRASPLFEVHLDPASERRAIQTAQRLGARCRTELGE